jgi:ParB family transcriptional regulator, chromosome partitioning protein
VPRGTLGHRKHSRPVARCPARSDPPEPEAAATTLRRDALLALANSIQERGVLQPIIIRPREPECYELIAGERRWRASRMAGLQTIPALVDDAADDAVSRELALIENIARADLTVIEEARTIASLLAPSMCPAPTSHGG